MVADCRVDWFLWKSKRPRLLAAFAQPWPADLLYQPSANLSSLTRPIPYCLRSLVTKAGWGCPCDHIPRGDNQERIRHQTDLLESLRLALIYVSCCELMWLLCLIKQKTNLSDDRRNWCLSGNLVAGFRSRCRRKGGKETTSGVWFIFRYLSKRTTSSTTDVEIQEYRNHQNCWAKIQENWSWQQESWEPTSSLRRVILGLRQVSLWTHQRFCRRSHSSETGWEMATTEKPIVRESTEARKLSKWRRRYSRVTLMPTHERRNLLANLEEDKAAHKNSLMESSVNQVRSSALTASRSFSLTFSLSFLTMPDSGYRTLYILCWGKKNEEKVSNQLVVRRN